MTATDSYYIDSVTGNKLSKVVKNEPEKLRGENASKKSDSGNPSFVESNVTAFEPNKNVNIQAIPMKQSDAKHRSQVSQAQGYARPPKNRP